MADLDEQVVLVDGFDRDQPVVPLRTKLVKPVLASSELIPPTRIDDGVRPDDVDDAIRWARSRP